GRSWSPQFTRGLLVYRALYFVPFSGAGLLRPIYPNQSNQCEDMAQDFAKRSPARRNKGAARRQAPSAGTHWSWFFTGLMCGLFVAFVGYLGLKPAPGQDGVTGEEILAAD